MTRIKPVDSLVLMFLLLSSGMACAYTEKILNYKKSIGDHADFSICYPDGWKAGDKRPAIILAHGGSWTSGTYEALSGSLKWTPYFSDKGMVAISINYRLDRIANAVMDCRSAIRYIKSNADAFGIDPDRVVAGGQSAGGHLAFCMYGATGLDDPADDLSISPRPNLFVFLDGALSLSDPRMNQIAEDVGAELAAGCQPALNVRSDFPPALYLYGDADGYRESGHLCYDRALAFGIRQEMWMVPGGKHGYSFTNLDWNQNSIRLVHQFLSEYGYVSGPPTAPPSTGNPTMYKQDFGGGRTTLIAPGRVAGAPSEKPGQEKENMINGSGFTNGPTEQNSFHEFSDQHAWRSLAPHLGEVIFDFGSRVDFDQVHLWNYHGSGNDAFLGINEVEVSSSSDSDPATANFTRLGTLRLFQEGNFCQNYPLTGTDVRFLKFNILSNHASIYTGLNEMRVSHSSSLGGVILPTHVVLDKLRVSLGSGESVQLRETAYPDSATSKSVTWSTSDPSVVRVNSSGLVSAIAKGRATVTATTVSGVAAAQCLVSVDAAK